MRALAFLVAAGFALAACSSDPPAATTGAAGGGGSSGPGGGQGGQGAQGGGSSSGGGGSGPTCDAPEPDHDETGITIDSVSAVFVDQNDAAASGVVATVCGTVLCSDPFESGGDGSVDIDGQGSTYGAGRFNQSHLGRGFAKLSAFIPDSPTHDFGQVRVFRFAPFSEGVEIVAGESASHGGVTLTLPAGASIKHDLLSFMEDERGLLGLVVDISGYPESELPGFDPALNIEVLVAASPLGTKLCPAAAMSFDNVRGWEAGADVEILLHGTKIFDHYAPYGEWAVIAEAVVSEDGTVVETKDGEGVETLGTFGARLAQ